MSDTGSDTGQELVRDITLNLLLDRILAGWRTPLVFSAVAVLVALLLLALSHPVYEVKMSVVPAPSSQAEMGMSNTGGLSTLLGLADGQGSSSYSRYQTLLTSTAVAERLARKHNMLQTVFSNNWDAQQKKWVAPQTVRGWLLGWLFDLSGIPIWTPPDANDLALYLKNNILVMEPVNRDIVTVSMRDADSAFARRLILLAHQEADEVLRDQVAIRSEQQVSYLQKKLSQTTVQDYRQTLLTMLAAQEKNLMLTKTSAPYAAEILIPLTSSERPVAPRPVLTLVLAVVVGLLAGISVTALLGPDWVRKLRPAGRVLVSKLKGTG